MSHSHPSGLLATYNSLTDKHLVGYFNNTRIRRHLLRSGLITRSGRILSEKEYKLNIMKRDHQKYVRECLAQAIFHKVLDMERYHQLEIKKKLENLARKERIQRFKGEHTGWSMDDNIPVLSPHPPIGPKTKRGQSVLTEGHSSPLTLAAPRPYTAPENIQPPIRLQPLPSNPAVGIAGSKSKTSVLENEAPLSIGGKKAMMKHRNFTDNSHEMNSYLLPNINNYLVPSPPPSLPHGRKTTRENKPETWRRRQLRPTTAPNDIEPNINAKGEPKRIHKTPLHTNATITMMYYGKNVRLSYYDHPDFRDEIKVYQQHCGGENLCVYKGRLLEKETFQFVSKRHHGFPFSLTFFLNGIQVNRISSCCEFKHRKGSRLGGKRGYFGFVGVEKSSPCYKCIIAMGLDKKATPLKPRKEKSVEKREDLKKSERKLKKAKEIMKSRKSEVEGSRNAPPVIYSAHGETSGIREVRTAVEELEYKGKPGQNIWEDEQEHIFKYGNGLPMPISILKKRRRNRSSKASTFRTATDDYEEDFELEEKQDVKTNRERRTSDQRNGMSKSPSDDEKDHLDTEKESETSSQKASDVNDNRKHEDDECSDSELDENKQDIKTVSSASSRSHPYSSCSDGESILGEEVRDDNISNGSLSSQERNKNDEPEKNHLSNEDTLKIEDKEIVQSDLDTTPQIIEENLENILDEETEIIIQVSEEVLSEKSGGHVSKEDKENSKLWKDNPAKAKDKKAGPNGVEKGGHYVGEEPLLKLSEEGSSIKPKKIISETLESDCHSYYDAEYDVGSTDVEKNNSMKPENDTGSAPNRNLVVEERAALCSNKESKQVASEICILEKKEAVQENEVTQHMAADIIEEKANTAQWEKTEVNETPLGEWKPSLENSALAEEEGEILHVLASKAETGGARDLYKDVLSPKEKDSGGLKEDEVPEQLDLMQAVVETEAVISEEEQGSEKPVLANKVAVQSSETFEKERASQEVEVMEMRDADKGKALSEPEKPDEVYSVEESITDREEKEAKGDTVSWTGVASEEAKLESGEESAQEKEVTGRETLLSTSSSENKQETSMGSLEESNEELYKEEVAQEEAEKEAETYREDDRKEMLPEELDVGRDRAKIERPDTPAGETESEREEVTRASGHEDEDTVGEEQKFKGEEERTMKEGRLEEETQVSSSKIESEAPIEQLQSTEGVENSLNEGEVKMLEADPGFEISLENATALRGEEGEGLIENNDTEYQDRADVFLGVNVSPPKQEEGLGLEGEGVSDAPESEPAEKIKTPEGTVTATDEGQEFTAPGQDGFSGRDIEGDLLGTQLVEVMTTTLEDVPEEYSMMVIKSSAEVVDETQEEGADEMGRLEAAEVKKENVDKDGNFIEGVVVTEEDQGGKGEALTETAIEKREVSADSKSAENKTEANKVSFSDVAEEETWDTVGNIAAAEKVAEEEISLSGEVASLVEKVPVTWALDGGVGTLEESSNVERNFPPLTQDSKGQELEFSQGAASAERESGPVCPDGQEGLGAAIEFRLGLSEERESDLSKSLQDEETLTKSNFAGFPEKTEYTHHKESDTTEVSLDNTMT